MRFDVMAKSTSRDLRVEACNASNYDNRAFCDVCDVNATAGESLRSGRQHWRHNWQAG
jgi:hypothetical protein